MMNKTGKIIKRMIVMIAIVSLILPMQTKDVHAEQFILQNGRRFDTIFYATLYPDLRAKYGYDSQKLMQHYLKYGIYERRIPSKWYLTNMDLLNLAQDAPENLLYRRKSLSKGTTPGEFHCAYLWARNLVSGIPRLQTPGTMLAQMNAIAQKMYDLVTVFPGVGYTISDPHYNDPCGVFGINPPTRANATVPSPLGASSAGVTRATGLCLNVLEIPYEHVNENKWKHQWCRINYNGTYYAIDPYAANFAMPETTYVKLYAPFMTEL